MDDPLVEKLAPWPVDGTPEGEAGDHEEIRYAKGLREGDHLMQPARGADLDPDAERRMYHRHEDDAPALGIIDPEDAAPLHGGAVGFGRRGGFGRRAGLVA